MRHDSHNASSRRRTKPFGLGWHSEARNGGYQWSNAGTLAGSSAAWLVRTPDGSTLAVLFNSLPVNVDAFFIDLLSRLEHLLRIITAWPEIDLFG